MKQIMYVTNQKGGAGFGGREQLSLLHSNILLELFGGGFDRVELDGVAGVGKLLGYIDGVSRSSIHDVCERIRRSGAKRVFLDGSNLGKLAQAIRQSSRDVEIVTFFHNCEARFFLGSLRQQPSLRALGVLAANHRAERLSVRSSDKLICLSLRDSRQLERWYGRGGTHIVPMAMQDQLPPNLPRVPTPPREVYALFVGGTFYANRQGIGWFVNEVAARSPVKTYVVGKGFEKWKATLERNGNVEVVGSVDSLAPWYLGAHFVIAPIFDGSGMKTKVAEALMFGKRVVGTPEAFVGYEAVVDSVGAVCETAPQFLAALETEAARPFAGIDRELRLHFESRYSFRAARDLLARILLA